MTLVIDRLYLGNFKQARSYQWLKEHNITHIVNSAIEIPNFYEDKFTYLRLDLYDTSGQDILPALEKSYTFISSALQKGGSVLVHCLAGMSRSSSIVIYYLMRSKGWTYDEAYNFLKGKHPITNPNEGFESQLRSLSFRPQVSSRYPREYISIPPPPQQYYVGGYQPFHDPTDIMSYYYRGVTRGGY